MFNSETARIAGKKGGMAGGKKGGSRSSAVKTVAARANGLKAVELGVANGRPSLGCTCNKEPHSSTCRIYMAQKKRESRARLKEREAVVNATPRPTRTISEKKRAAILCNSKVVTEKRSTRAREIGRLYGGRPPSVCNCGQEPHTSRCRVYLAQKKRESRARMKASTPVPD